MKLQKLIVKSVLVMSFLAFVCSCNEKIEYLNVLPEGPVAVSKIELAQLVVKADVANNTTLQSLKGTALIALPREQQDVVKEIIEDPAKSGIDFTRPLVAAGYGKDQNTAEAVVVMAMNEKAAFTNLISQVNNGYVNFEEKDGATVATIQDGATVAYNDKSLVLCYSKMRSAADLLNLNANQQAIKQDKILAKILSADDDLAFYFDYDHLMNLVKNLNPQSAEVFNNGINFEGVKCELNLNFLDGEIKSESKVHNMTDEMKKMMDMYETPSGEALALQPKDAYAAMNYAVKGLNNAAKMYNQEIIDDVNAKLADIGLSVDDFAEIEGDITGSISYISRENVNLMVLVGMKSDKIWSAFEQFLGDNEKIAEHVYGVGKNKHYDYNPATGAYEIMTRGEDFYVGYADGYFFFMPEGSYRSLLKDGKWTAESKNFSDTDLAKEIKKGGIIVDFNGVKQNVASLGAPKQATYVLNKLEYLKVERVGQDAAEMIVTFNDHKKNALKQIVEITEDVVRMSMGQ